MPVVNSRLPSQTILHAALGLPLVVVTSIKFPHLSAGIGMCARFFSSILGTLIISTNNTAEPLPSPPPFHHLDSLRRCGKPSSTRPSQTHGQARQRSRHPFDAFHQPAGQRTCNLQRIGKSQRRGDRREDTVERSRRSCVSWPIKVSQTIERTQLLVAEKCAKVTHSRRYVRQFTNC